jgi:hypothetical protein
MTDRKPVLPSAFWRQWTASLISNLGDGVNYVAMPLLVLSLTDDARVLALATTTAFLPWMVMALPVGVAVDRFDRQRLMVGANVLRTALFALIAAGAGAGWLGVWALLGVLLAIGVCEVVFDSSAQAFLPRIVAGPALARANGVLMSTELIAGSVIGLAVGALLYDAAIGLPFGVNAASFAIAAAIIATIVARGAADGAEPIATSEPPSLMAGLQWLWRHRMLRTLAAMLTVTNLGLLLGQGVFVKYAVEELELGPTAFAILLGTTAVGAATGGLIGHRVVAAVGLRWAVVLPYLVFGIGNVALGASPVAWLSAIASFVLGAAIMVWNVVTITLRQRLIPQELFGRVNGAFRWLGAAAGAVSVALGGVLAHATTVRMPYFVGGALTLLTAVLFARPALAGLDDA